MTDQLPPPPGPPTPPESAATPAEEPAPRRGVSRKLIVGGVAAALVLAGGAAFGITAYSKLSGGGTQPHDVLPASTQLYARLDVDPSASQKIDLLKLIRRFPEAAEAIGIKRPTQDVRQLVFNKTVSDECPDIDYGKDIKPWLGERIGAGGNLEDKTFEIALQVTDEDKARDGIKKIFACSDEDYGIAFLDGYAILSDKQSTVDAGIKAAEKKALGDTERFTDDFEALGDQGVASAWADVDAVLKVPDVAKALTDASAKDREQLSAIGSVASTLRVDGSALELAALSGGSQPKSSTPTDLTTLPSDTVLALSVVGVGDQIGPGFDNMVKEFGTGFAQSYLDELEQGTGLKLPADLETLFGDSLTLAVGGRNLETLPTLSGPDAISSLDVALSLTSDPAKALDLVKRLAALAETSGVPLIAAPTDNGAVLATNQAAADAIVKPDGKLGDESTFTEVIPHGESSYGGFYVNIGAIIDKVLKADPPEDVAKDLEEAKPLSALGFSVSQADGDRSLASLRLAFR